MAKLIKKYYVDKDGKKRLSTWQAEFYDAQRYPRRKRVSLHTKDEEDAMRMMVRREREYILGAFDPWTDKVQKEGVLLSEAVATFLKSKRREGRKEKTLQNYDDLLRIFKNSLPPGTLVVHLEPRHVEAFLAAQRLNATSRTTYLRQLKVFLHWCVKEGLRQDVPLPAHQKQRQKARRKMVAFLTREQYQQLLCAIEASAIISARRFGNPMWLADVVQVAVHTGLRLGELCRLRWRDVDLRTGFLTVRESKSGHERSVFLAGEANEVLTRLHATRTSEVDDVVFKAAQGGQLPFKPTSRRFRTLREEAGLPASIHFHSLRHTFASWAVLGGMDLFKLKEILGHADIKMTLIYAHLRPDAQKEDMLRIFGSQNGEATPTAQLKEMKVENKRLRKQNRKLRKENEQLRAELEALRPGRVEEPALARYAAN